MARPSRRWEQLTNNGTFTLNSTGTNTELRLTGNLTLGGPGKLTLSNNAANLISATATTDVLTNASTIQGSGNLGNGAMGVVNTKTITANQSTPLIIDTSSAGFNNTGTLTVRKGDTLQIKGGAFANLSGTTLTGGTYSVSGTLLYNSTSDIVTNAASITLTGASAQIINQSGGNGLANFATNNGSFSLQSGSKLTTGGNFTNTGTFTIGSGSAFTVGGTGTAFAQTAGTTTDSGTLTLLSSSALTLSGGTLFGNGTINGGLTSSSTVTPGTSSTATGILTDKGAYTQNSTGVLDISIGGTTAGTQYDQVNPTSAKLNGTLTTTLINGFTPTVGQQFTIMNFGSETGTFASCDGTAGGATCPINSSEHFTVTYNPTDVVLTVVSGAAPTFSQFKRSGMGRPVYNAGSQARSVLVASGRGPEGVHGSASLTAPSLSRGRGRPYRSAGISWA